MKTMTTEDSRRWGAKGTTGGPLKGMGGGGGSCMSIFIKANVSMTYLSSVAIPI